MCTESTELGVASRKWRELVAAKYEGLRVDELRFWEERFWAHPDAGLDGDDLARVRALRRANQEADLKRLGLE
jgi:hypothetical protein